MDPEAALPRVTPYLLRRAGNMCSRRLACEVQGGTRSDDPVTRGRMRDAFLARVKEIHADFACPTRSDFDGLGEGLEPEERAVLSQAASWYVALFGDHEVRYEDHELETPTESPGRGLRIGGWVDLALVDRHGAKHFRQFDLWAGRTPADPFDLEAVRIAVLRLSRWAGPGRLTVAWADLVRGALRERVIIVEDALPVLREWFDTEVVSLRAAIERPVAANGPDCGQCNFIAGCPEHGDWHGRARSARDDFRPAILRLSPTALASWDRCRREWRNSLLTLPTSDPPGPTAHGLQLHALLKLLHEEGSCRDELLLDDVLERHGLEESTLLRSGLEKHARRCPTGAEALGHELTRSRFRFRPGPPFIVSARFDALWSHDGFLDAHDYKTGRVWDHELVDDRQARAQAWVLAPLAEALGLRLRITFEHLSPDVDEDPKPFEPEPDDIDTIEAELHEMVLAMRSETDFAGVADGDVCGYCRYRSICPDSAVKGEALWPRVEEQDDDA